MARFRLCSLFLVVTVVAIICAIVHFLLHIDDPLATVVVSEDLGIVFTENTAIELSALALRKVGLEPFRPDPAYGHEGDPERFISRNALRPNDEVTVDWFVRGSTYPVYSVTLKRESSRITAQIDRNLAL